MADLHLVLQLLVLLGVANLAPILVKRLIGQRLAAPLDGGLAFFDGRPLLGPSKTIRGVLAAVVATTIVGMLMGFPALLAAQFGALSMAGDALASFVKRRLGIAPSGRAPGLDQLVEAALPLLVLRNALGLSWPQLVTITLVFFVLHVPLSKLLARLRLRDRPH
ncbi:CDP-archaeol synthase [Piscinibacter sakaiensis]|uniref:CDP-archaeol synthase n=1 Tax=Piscinibacter sakaiensis TaxID=1547922 RepID=UPI003AAB29D9